MKLRAQGLTIAIGARVLCRDLALELSTGRTVGRAGLQRQRQDDAAA